MPELVKVQEAFARRPTHSSAARAHWSSASRISRNLGLRVGRVEVGIMDLALFPTGAHHQVHPAPVGQRLSDNPTGRKDLVVRVGVDQQQSPGGLAHAGPSARMAASYPRFLGVSTAPNRTQFTSHSMGLIMRSGTAWMAGLVTACARRAV